MSRSDFISEADWLSQLRPYHLAKPVLHVTSYSLLLTLATRVECLPIDADVEIGMDMIGRVADAAYDVAIDLS